MSTATAPRVDLVANLLRRALDPAAEVGEATNAANKMVTVARREGLHFTHLAEHIGRLLPPPATTRSTPRDEPPIEAFFVMRFGKHRGRTMRDLIEMDPGYVEWLASTVDDGRTRAAAGAVLRWKRGQR